jgi:nicotinamide riboside kinase
MWQKLTVTLNFLDNMKTKLLCVVGAPSSGKSTLATHLHADIKKNGKNSIFISEEATNFIAEYGVPTTPIDQMTIFYKQTNKENMFIGSKEYIICDSSGFLNYFYFRKLFKNPLSNKDIAVINHLQKEILKNFNKWDYIFYIPPMLNNIDDGIRFQDKDEIISLDRCIKSYLDVENINYYDLSKIKMDERVDYIKNIIL